VDKKKVKAEGVPARPAHPPGGAARSSAPTRHWVVLQGDTATVEESAGAPAITVSKGERRKRVMYASTDRAQAEARAAAINARSQLRGTAKGAA